MAGHSILEVNNVAAYIFFPLDSHADKWKLLNIVEKLGFGNGVEPYPTVILMMSLFSNRSGRGPTDFGTSRAGK